MSLKDLLQQDLDNVFLNTDECAEEVQYYSASLEQYFAINAIVDRKRIMPDEFGVGGTNSKQGEIRISKTQITKVLVGDDRVVIEDNNGQLVQYGVEEILSSQNGEWHLVIEK